MQRAKDLYLFFALVVREFLHDHGPIMAAAMSFFATLSLFPLLLFGVSALGYILGPPRAFQDIMSVFRQYAPGPVAMVVHDTLANIVATRRKVLVIGVLALLWTATNVFANMETALCITWNVERRPWWKSRLLAVGMVVVLGATLFVTLGFTALTLRIEGLKWSVFGYPVPDLPAFWHFMGYLVPILVGFISFTIVYIILPNTRVHRLAALYGGVFSGIFWQIALQGFRAYLAHAHYDLVYGSLGGGVILVLWIYYTMIVLLLGAEVAWQADQRLRRKEGRVAETPAEKLATPARLP